MRAEGAGGECSGHTGSAPARPLAKMHRLLWGLTDPVSPNMLIAIYALCSLQGCRLGRSSLQSPQPLSGGGQPVMDSTRTNLQSPRLHVALGSVPLSSASPLSWLSPSPSILEGGPKR